MDECLVPTWQGYECRLGPPPVAKTEAQPERGPRRENLAPPLSESRGLTPFAFSLTTAGFWRTSSREGRVAGAPSGRNSCFSGWREGILIRVRRKLVCERLRPTRGPLDARKIEEVTEK